MILALFCYISLLRLILHHLLPPASRFSAAVAHNQLVQCAEGRHPKHCLQNSCLVNGEPVCLFILKWTITNHLPYLSS